MRAAHLVVAFVSTLLWESYNAQYVFNCGLDGKTPISYTKGDQTYLCFHFMPYKVKLGFLVTIDEYTGFEIPDSFTYFEGFSPDKLNIHAQLDVYSQYSPASLYLWKTPKYVVNVMHLVITLKEGNLESLTWDNDCYGCNKTDKCRQIKTDYTNEKGTKTMLDYKTCADDYCVIQEEKNLCNLKVNSLH